MSYENFINRIAHVEDEFYNYTVVNCTEQAARIVVTRKPTNHHEFITPGIEVFNVLATDGFRLEYIGRNSNYDEMYLNFKRFVL